MKNINYPMLFLAMLVVSMFCLVGVAIFYQNVFLVILFLLLGFALMGYGIKLKRKSDN
ncbi:DUF5325 family protein [Pseudogracilibacillus auburnensis]|uniref:Uncharacterized protein n=1 Tax=Pseudogracilibacillus auburnensis TaxID=1494959 RepID=A0A2V3W6N7_9BACI|nr:DUF5325 family protein [Pseudogracilibacillus auburnensis]PXW89246.1 hypothetical protein DFR56_10222 [Pseudogracilibacillus auburnensis]